MPVAPFVPLISSGIGALFGGSKSDQPNMTPQQQQAYSGATGAAGQMTGLSKMLQQQGALGAPAYGQAINYYQTLLQGNRGAMQAAVAPAANQIADNYKGSQMNLERLGIQGGQKLQAEAELNRQKAGQLGQLTVGLQPMAAQALGNLGVQGANMIGQAGNLQGQAGNIYAGLLGQQTQMANTQYNRNQDFGSSLSKIVGQGLGGALDWWKSRGGGFSTKNA